MVNAMSVDVIAETGLLVVLAAWITVFEVLNSYPLCILRTESLLAQLVPCFPSDIF